jgi:hypothetical protein
VVSELQLFYGLLGLLTLIYVHFVWDVVTYLAGHLGIRCLTIPRNAAAKKTPAATTNAKKSKGN